MSKQPIINIDDLEGSEWLMKVITAKDLHKTIPFHKSLIDTQKKKGGTLVRIFQFPCYIPPVPTQPKKNQPNVFINDYIKETKHQKWTRQLLTKRSHVDARDREDAMMSAPVTMTEWGNYMNDFDTLYAKYIDGEEDCWEFLEIFWREVERIKNGCWIYINGVETYLPGAYYFYLNYWTSKDGGMIEYIECDRQEFIHFEAVIKSHPQFRGTVHYRCRQDGKSLRHSCKMYWLVMRSQQNGWIQSKDETDVAAIFDDCISLQSAKLPMIFQPHGKKQLFELIGKEVKETLLEKKRSKKATKLEFSATRTHTGGSLNGVMAVGKNKATGRSGIAKWDDETGSTANVDTVERQEKSMQSMKHYFISTTIDDTTKQCLEACKKMWRISDYRAWEEDASTGKRGVNTSTQSKLLSCFKPAYYCFWNRAKDIKCVDEYGQPQLQKALDYIQGMRQEALDLGDDEKYLQCLRHYPLTPEEAMLPDASNSAMPIPEITAQMRRISVAEAQRKGYLEVSQGADAPKLKLNLPIRYRLTWKNGVRFSEVIAEPDENGQHWISELPDKPNNVKKRRADYGDNAIWYEPMSERYCCGIDPIDMNKGDMTGRNKFSNGVAVTFAKSTGFFEKENMFVHLYSHRPDLSDDYYEECLKANWLFGCVSSLEFNKVGFKKYYENSGCQLFVGHKMDLDPTKKITANEFNMRGTTLDSVSRPRLFEVIVKYAKTYSHLIVFKQILDDYIHAELTTLTDHDIAAGTMQAVGFGTHKTMNSRYDSTKANTRKFAAMKGLKEYHK